MSTTKCGFCGRFLSHEEMGAGGLARFHFEPLNEFGAEIAEWECADCVIAEAENVADEALYCERTG